MCNKQPSIQIFEKKKIDERIHANHNNYLSANIQPHQKTSLWRQGASKESNEPNSRLCYGEFCMRPKWFDGAIYAKMRAYFRD